MQSVKERIRRAKVFYKSKNAGSPLPDSIFIRELPTRVILLSDSLTEPTIENLWNYHRHFFAQIGEENREKFAFEDIAGIYEKDGQRRMFTICTRSAPNKDLLPLPAGKYLCAECTEQTRGAVRGELLARAEANGHASPPFLVELVVLTGILQWKYEMQIWTE